MRTAASRARAGHKGGDAAEDRRVGDDQRHALRRARRGDPRRDLLTARHNDVFDGGAKFLGQHGYSTSAQAPLAGTVHLLTTKTTPNRDG